MRALRHALVPAVLLLALAAWSPRAAANEPLKTVHVLMAFDTADDTIGDTVDIDRRRLEALVRRQFPPGHYTLKVLKGRDVTPDNVMGYYRDPKLSVGPDTGLVFYFAGHGGSREGRTYLNFAHGTKQLYRKDLRAQMEKREAGLVVLLTDCCSTRDEKRRRSVARGAPVAPIEGHAHSREAPSGLAQDLFFRARGTVSITAATFDEAYCDEKNGGVFTRALCSVLTSPPAELRKAGPMVSWHEAFPPLRRRTQELFEQLQKVDHTLARVPKQTPQQFSLGNPANKSGRLSTYAALGLRNATAQAVRYQYRWEGESEWKTGTLAAREVKLHSRRLGSPSAPAGRLEVRLGNAAARSYTAERWTGERPPTAQAVRNVDVKSGRSRSVDFEEVADAAQAPE